MASPAVMPYTLFQVEVLGASQLTPHMRRITFGGELSGCVSAGLDQRIKIFFPPAGEDVPSVPVGEKWYEQWRALDEEVRPPMRTYTIRRHRRETNELDVDFVLHGDTGPASAWASRAEAGQRLSILAPDARHTPILGYEFKPGADTDWYLLAGDETALPAISAILESLREVDHARVFVEVDSLRDVQPIDTPADVHLTWLTRADTPAGGRGPLGDAVRDAVFPRGRPYAWLAGESSVATGLRRHLVNDRRIDKESVYFAGYWLLGSPIE